MPDLTKDQMIKCFTDGYKKKSEWLIGTEHEKFGFFKKSLEPISYNEILKIFNQLSKQFGWKKVYENSKVISLQKKKSSITLEPGGQIELSGAPLKSLFDTCKEVNQHYDELNKVCEPMNIDFLGMGVLPKWKKDKINLMPKERYKIMTKYMPTVGSMGLDMMFRTSTIQANFDFSSEDDMKKKIILSQSIQPVIIALYANSPFIEGKITDYMSYRSFIWTNTDPGRCGLLKFIYNKNFSFEMYVDYLLELPMYFVIRKNKYIDMTNLRFKDYLNKKKLNFKPTLEDWKIHMTTVFPEVRLKNYIEVRGADGGPWSRVCALPAFWTGLLYDEKNLNLLTNEISSWKFDDILMFYENVRKFGLKTKTPDGENLVSFTKKILNLANEGLKEEKFLIKIKMRVFF